MPTLQAYPSCCGGNIITGFSGDEAQCLREFANCVATADNRRLLKFVLNDGQCARYPRVLAEAARMGFVMSASWINSVHDSRLYEFQRAGDRIRMTAAAEAIGWTGPLISPHMGGLVTRDAQALLPNVDANFIGGLAAARPWVAVGDYVRTTRLIQGMGANIPVGSIVRISRVQGGDVHGHYLNLRLGESVAVFRKAEVERVQADRLFRPNDGEIIAGSRVRVNSPTSRFHGIEFTVLRTIDGGWDRPNRLALMQEDPAARITVTNLVLLNQQQAAPGVEVLPFRDVVVPGQVPAPPPGIVIHVEAVDGQEVVERVVERLIPAPPPPPVAPYVAATLYQALFADDTVGVLRATVGAVREAAPRVRRYREVQIMNNGDWNNIDRNF